MAVEVANTVHVQLAIQCLDLTISLVKLSIKLYGFIMNIKLIVLTLHS